MFETLKRIRALRSLLLPVYNATVRKVLNSYRYWIFRNEPAFPPLPADAPEVVPVRVMPDGRFMIQGAKEITVEAGALMEAFPKAGWFALIEDGAVFSERGIPAVRRAILDSADAELIYGDTDRLTASGRRTDPWFKPDFNIYAFRQENLLRPLCVARRELLLRAAAPGAAISWPELTFRLVEAASRVDHCPEILTHWTAEYDPAGAAVLALENEALRAHLNRTRIDARIYPLRALPCRRVRYALRSAPLVSILIPNKDQRELLARCVASIRERTTYPNYEILIIENNSVTPEIEAYYRELEADPAFPGKVIRYPGRFNFSLINNWGAERSKGELLLFLNNDTEVLSPNWLEEMVSLAIREDVGAVGAKLLFPDRKIQHAGVSFGSFGERWLFHVYEGLAETAPSYHGATRKLTPALAVTGACLMMRRALFDEIGRFPADLPIVYNDIEICFAAFARGKTNLFTPFARLVHYESASRGKTLTEAELETIRRDFRRLIGRYPEIYRRPDPFYSSRLTFDQMYFEKIT